jgi:chromosome segregation ATPase
MFKLPFCLKSTAEAAIEEVRRMWQESLDNHARTNKAMGDEIVRLNKQLIATEESRKAGESELHRDREAIATRKALVEDIEKLKAQASQLAFELSEVKRENDELSVELEATRHERDLVKKTNVNLVAQMSAVREVYDKCKNTVRPNWKKQLAEVL